MGMRLMEKLRAHQLTDYGYPWDSTYAKILNRDSEAYADTVRTTAYGAVSISSTDSANPAVTTYEFILARKYKYNTVLDGVARGNVKLWVQSGQTSADCGLEVYERARINLIARKADATSRTIGTTVTNYISVAAPSESTATLTIDVPYWIDVEGEIENDERVILSVDYESYNGGISGSCFGSARGYWTKATDELFVEIPIVP